MTDKLEGKFTNACQCQDYDIETGEWYEATEHISDCWEYQLDDFAYISQDLFDISHTFRIDGFPTWYGQTGGIFDASNAEELLLAITPRNTEWSLRVTIEQNYLTGVLSHHDGAGTITVTPIVECPET